MQRVEFDQSTGRNLPIVEQSVRADQSGETADSSRDALEQQNETLQAKVRRLEAEVQSYRSHAQRTSRIFAAVTSYAEWIRESARRDGELALKKARERADETLGSLARERERTERELQRLQALTEETRRRLSTFTAAALDVLNAEVGGAEDGSTPPLPEDLRAALRSGLVSAEEPGDFSAEEPGDAPEAVAHRTTH